MTGTVDDKQQLPAQQLQQYDSGDGFDDRDEGGGFGPIEKFVDGDWFTGNVPADPQRRLVAVYTESWLRRWQGKQVIDEIKNKPLFELEHLLEERNAAIPQSEWELDPFTGSPRKPYELVHRVDLLNLDSAEHTTFLAATKGAKAAVKRLRDQVKWSRKMRGGQAVVPQVVLTSAPFKTQYGMKKRPDFRVSAWFDLSSGGPTAVQASAPKALPPVAPTPVKEPSIGQSLNDSIPF
jgi:hypothetical protein